MPFTSQLRMLSLMTRGKYVWREVLLNLLFAWRLTTMVVSVSVRVLDKPFTLFASMLQGPGQMLTRSHVQKGSLLTPTTKPTTKPTAM